ncbi:gephyrin-like molybdotransferase Glp [Maritalea sp.]|jgi:molybdopterin molybdotransferase|uniref:molybdopterin molybdotransferase MoeA n=1 Tax=Maritalea sp. TaxID=2003361 RepID=UPI0039E31CE5
MTLLPVADALKTIIDAISPTQVETVSLDRANGRLLAADITATFDQPPFDGSAMDGYALNADDGAKGTALNVVGISAAGEAFDGTLSAGQCTRIYTGAPMPKGANAVIMQEKITRQGDQITLNDDVIEKQNVRDKGNDFASGDVLIGSGTKLSPFHVALAAAANQAHMQLRKNPTLTLVATGDELVPPGSTLKKDQIIASNGFGLTPLFTHFGANVKDGGIIKDDRKTLKSELKRLLDEEPDILVTTGGASVGDRDYVKEVLEVLGVNLSFWKIAVRPGKPLMFGTLGKTTIFGLPGNPVSALVTGTVFVVPAIKAKLGQSPEHMIVQLPLTADMASNGPRQHYRRAKLTKNANGTLAVDPHMQSDSAHLTSLSASDCFVVQKPLEENKGFGEMVDVLMMPWVVG